MARYGSSVYGTATYGAPLLPPPAGAGIGFRLKPEFLELGVDGSLAYPPLGQTFDFSAAVPAGIRVTSQELIVELRAQIAGSANFPFEEVDY
jgi:hypothetical protein